MPYSSRLLPTTMQYRTLSHTHLVLHVVRAYSLFFRPGTPRDVWLATTPSCHVPHGPPPSRFPERHVTVGTRLLNPNLDLDSHSVVRSPPVGFDDTPTYRLRSTAANTSLRYRETRVQSLVWPPFPLPTPHVSVLPCSALFLFDLIETSGRK